ncbi:hypothetical protein ABK933_03625 [Klebsiella aerogenes]|uniref:hypothetical protein n=1 Tax=Klebsiella aerogenes TaxID=548 RepID=UPI0037531A4F
MTKSTYELDVNNVTKELMTLKLNMTEEEAQFLLDYRNKFKILEGDDSALVSLEQLWEVLDRPYGGFRQWKQEVAIPECQLLSSEISDKRLPTKGRPKINSFVDTDTAKHLAMMSRTDKGRVARRYFITIEKLFKNVCEYNNLRISIESRAKKVAHDAAKKTYGNRLAIGAAKNRFNRLMSVISGKRNDLSTDLVEYEHAARSVERMIINGITDDVILSAHV